MAAFARTELDAVGLARKATRRRSSCSRSATGKMIGRDVFLLDASRRRRTRRSSTSFLEQYYASAGVDPRARSWFHGPRRSRPTSRRSSPAGAVARVHIRVPQRGEKRALMELASRNAGETLAREQARWLADEGKTLAALEELAAALELPGPPMRIECYDISNIQGAESVGSMVVFEEGRPRSGEYRRFRIQSVSGPNDFASHQEVLRRRFRRARTGEEGNEEELRWPLPDLVIIDGGKGQVSAGKEVLDELGLHDMPLAGLAKEREELFLPGRAEPIVLPPTSPALYLVQRLRDEAHRFAITYHRNLRAKRDDDPRSTTCPASARSGSGRCCGCSVRPSGSARRRSSRSRRCRASAAHSRRRSRRPGSLNRCLDRALGFVNARRFDDRCVAARS